MVCLFWISFNASIARFSPNGEDLLLANSVDYLIRNVSTGKYSQRFVRRNQGTYDRGAVALSSDATHITTELNDTIHVLAWDDLDREEIDTGSKDDDYTSKLLDRYQSGRAWHKKQHLVIVRTRSTLYPSRNYLRVLDPAGTAVLNAVPKMTYDESYKPDQPLAEVSPENNHWTIAYVNQWDSLCLWNIDEKEVFTIDKSLGLSTIFTFSTNGDRLCLYTRGKIKVWDVRTRTLSSRGRVSGRVTALAFSQTGATFWVAYQTDEDAFVEERDSESHETINGPFLHHPCIRSIFVKERDSESEKSHFDPHKLVDLFIRSIFVTFNDTYICTCSESRHRVYTRFRLGILDRSTGESIHYSDAYKPPVSSPNRKYIAWAPCGVRNEVHLWDMERGLIAFKDIPTCKYWVTMFCFSNDSKRICALDSAKLDGMDRVTIWDIQTKNIVTQCLLPPSEFDGDDWTGTPYSMALDGDSLLIVDSNGTAKVWDLRVYEIMTRLCSDHTNDPQFAEEFGHQMRRLIEDYKLRSEDTEVLDHALTAWNNASFSLWTKSSEDRWMLGPHDELLFWIPTWKMYRNLWYPSMSLMNTYQEKFTKLSFKNFVHGTRWTECKK